MGGLRAVTEVFGRSRCVGRVCAPLQARFCRFGGGTEVLDVPGVFRLAYPTRDNVQLVWGSGDVRRLSQMWLGLGRLLRAENC